jgi:hypothetical protein
MKAATWTLDLPRANTRAGIDCEQRICCAQQPMFVVVSTE